MEHNTTEKKLNESSQQNSLAALHSLRKKSFIDVKREQ